LFLLKNAIEETLPGFHYDLTNQYLVSVGELQIIIKYAEQQIKAEEPAQAVQTLNTVIQYVEKNIDDYDAKVKIYPKAVLLLSPLLIERNEFVSCMAICEKAIRMLCKKGILYDLTELMQLYVECSKHDLQTAQAVKYEKQLKALQEIYGDHQHSYKQNFRQFHNQEIYLINEMIHSCRISQGLSQEELSDEICATETLSRIECGKRVPSTRHFRALMEKLDTKQDYYNPELNTNNFLILEKHREMLQAISVFHIREGRALLEEIKEELRNEGQLNSPWNKQILLAEESLLLFHEKKLDSETFFHTCREVFACEEEGWKKDEFWDQFLTGYKAQLLNQLALVYGSQGKLDTSVYIWEKILYKLEESKVSLLDRYPVSMTAISNLSSGYGILNRLEDCIQISEKGIQFCLDSGRGIRLGKLLVNKAEALESCGKSDKNTCQRYVRQAFYMDDLFEIERSRDYVDRYYRSHFDENIQWY
jgi:transcriptional regulator with XRE-family HTH domain